MKHKSIAFLLFFTGAATLVQLRQRGAPRLPGSHLPSARPPGYQETDHRHHHRGFHRRDGGAPWELGDGTCLPAEGPWINNDKRIGLAVPAPVPDGESGLEPSEWEGTSTSTDEGLFAWLDCLHSSPRD